MYLAAVIYLCYTIRMYTKSPMNAREALTALRTAAGGGIALMRSIYPTEDLTDDEARLRYRSLNNAAARGNLTTRLRYEITAVADAHGITIPASVFMTEAMMKRHSPKQGAAA